MTVKKALQAIRSGHWYPYQYPGDRDIESAKFVLQARNKDFCAQECRNGDLDESMYSEFRKEAFEKRRIARNIVNGEYGHETG